MQGEVQPMSGEEKQSAQSHKPSDKGNQNHICLMHASIRKTKSRNKERVGAYGTCGIQILVQLQLKREATSFNKSQAHYRLCA